MITVYVTNTYLKERYYVLSVILGEFLGLEYQVIDKSIDTYKNTWVIEVSGLNGRLFLSDVFFSMAKEKWLTIASLPAEPLKHWYLKDDFPEVNLLEPSIPIIYGHDTHDHLFLKFGQDEVQFRLDIFGSIFYMLSRYEEVVLSNRDEHDRFPASASLAYKGGFVYRPIVDEYVELLWVMMKDLWPQLKRKPYQGKLFVTGDVDFPYDSSLSTPTKALKRVIGDIIKRHSLRTALQSGRLALDQMRGDWSLDPYNTFDWMMDTCEKSGKKMVFFFLCQNATDIDARYELSQKFIRQLLKKIHDRGHEIGMHGSYNTYQNPKQIRQERVALLQACESQGIDSSARGNRQHFLRWDTAQTPDYLDDVGFEYDTTGSFADVPGFRYGTSHPFPMWSWRKNAPLSIKQRPLVLMEDSVIADCYLGFDHTDEALNLMLTLKKRALQFGGDFTLLWHNSNLITDKDREFYKALIM